MLLVLLTALTVFPTTAFAAVSSGVGIAPVADNDYWTTRLNASGQAYSYRPPTAAGKILYCMDLGYSYRSGTESFLQSYQYRSATGADADDLWDDAVAQTGLGELNAIEQENVKWMMSYISTFTDEHPGSRLMALQTYIWDNQTNKSAGADASGDIDAGGFANADTYDFYVALYNSMLELKAQEDADLQAQVEEYAAQGIRASIVEDDSTKWAVLAVSSVSGRQSFFAYHCDRKVITSKEPEPGDPDDPNPPAAGDGDITFKKVIAGTDRGLDGAVYNIYLDGQIVGSDVTSGGGIIEVNDVTEGLWTFVEREAPEGYALDPTPHSVYVSVTDGDKQYTVTAEDKELPNLEVIKTDALSGESIPDTVISVTSVTGSYSTSVSTGPDGSASLEAIPTGVYVLREESVPSPYVLSHTEQVVALLPGQSVVARFQDYTTPGLEILKRNIADGSPIEGVTYQIEQIDGDYSTSATTDSQGRIFLEVPVGSYKITETNVPSHVILCDIPQTVSLEAGGTQTATFFNAVKPSLSVLKRNSITTDPLENACFHIYYGSDNTTTGEINDLGTYYTDSSGRISLTNVNSGWFKVVEEEPPTGFSVQGDGIYEFYLEPGGSKELIVDNVPLSALVVYKYDSRTGAALEGARFELRYLSGETSGTGGTVIGQYVTSSNGSFTVTGLREGTYICQELESPDGHLIDSEPQTVYISGRDQDVVTLRFGNAPLGSLLITKVSDDEKHTPLSDVEFLLTDSSGNFIGTNNGRYVTNSAGEILVEGLTPGTTVVAREVRAKPGYLLDDSPQYALIRSGETVGLEFRNAPAGNLVIVKRSSTPDHTPLEGVEFRITYADGSFVPTENGQLSSNGLYYTDREGQITISGVVGSLVVTETASILGYSIDEATRTQTVVVHANDTQTLYFYNKPETTLVLQKFIEGTDSEPLAGVEFLVTDSTGAVVGPNNGIYTSGADGRVVISGLTPGTTITARETKTVPGYVLDGTPQSIEIQEGAGEQVLTFWNQREGGLELVKVNAAKTSERIPDTTFEIRRAGDDALVDTVTTAADGRVFVPLPEGSYYALEIEANPNFRLDSTPIYFEVTDGEITYKEVTNEARSAILIHKVDTSGEGIYGVKFLLYDQHKNPIGEFVSDDDGWVYITADDLPDGSNTSGRFYLRELEAAEGYIIDEEYKTVYVRPGHTAEIEWVNEAVTGQIQVYKYAAEYNEITGTPPGTPLQGAVYEISNARTGKVVDYITTDARGVAASKPLPLTRYKVAEVTAPAYWQVDTTVHDVTLEYAGQIIKISAYDKTSDLGVSITKRGNAEVLAGNQMRYDFTVANTSNVPLENFFWHDRIPTDASTATVLTTGTYSARLNYRVLYKTNYTASYQVLASNLLTSNNYSFALNAIPKQAGEVVTDIYFDFGKVPVGFQSITGPTLSVNVSGNAVNGYQLVNRADVGGQYQGTWQTAQASWVTIVRRYTPTPTLPKTGY